MFIFFLLSLRVLYAVDEFNGFFAKTSFKDAQQKWVCYSYVGSFMLCSLWGF